MYLNRYRIFFLIGITVISILLLAAVRSNSISKPPEPERSVLDLTNWNPEQEIISLDGKWDFYWDKLLSYQQVQYIKPDCGVFVPGTWDQYRAEHKTLSGEGVATYRLNVKTNLKEGTVLALRMRTVSSAYKLYVNDSLVAQAGIVGTGAGKEMGAYKPQVAIFSVPDRQFDLIVQVSNFHYARGGIWDSISLGSINQIHHYDNMLVGKEAFLLGILLIIALFYLALFLLLKELRYTLYFSLLSLTAAVVIDTAGQFMLINMIFPFKTVIGIWYSVTGWMTLFLLLFMHELFPTKFSKIVSRIYLGLIVCYQFIFLFIEPVFYTKYSYLFNASEIAALILALAVVVMGAKAGYKNWGLNAISILFLLIGYIHDTLYLTNNFHSPAKEIFYWTALITLVMQMITQAQRIKVYFDNKASAELLFFQAQIKPHFLYNTINTILSVSRTDGERARNLLMDFSQYLRRSFTFKASDQLVCLSNEIDMALSYVDIEQARFGSRLKVNFYAEEGIGEVKVPILVLQPIIENAIIHGVLPKPQGGTVEIQVRQEERWLLFSVKDDGIGMSKQEIECLREQDGNKIGLANIEFRLRKLYRQNLQIESNPNTGTEVKWRILINRSW